MESERRYSIWLNLQCDVRVSERESDHAEQFGRPLERCVSPADGLCDRHRYGVREHFLYSCLPAFETVAITRKGGKLIFISHTHADKPAVEPFAQVLACLLYTSPSPRDGLLSRMPSSA